MGQCALAERTDGNAYPADPTKFWEPIQVGLAGLLIEEQVAHHPDFPLHVLPRVGGAGVYTDATGSTASSVCRYSDWKFEVGEHGRQTHLGSEDG